MAAKTPNDRLARLMAEAGFGLESNTKITGENAIREAFDALSEETNTRLADAFDWQQYLPWRYFPLKRQQAVIRRLANEVFDRRIKEKEEKRRLRAGSDIDAETRYARDLVDVLLDAFWDQVVAGDRRLVHEHAATFMIAGHETTSGALQWALYELARHPDVQQKCREEVRAVVGQDADVAYDHLQQGYADMVVAGGTESAIHGITIAAFSSMQALSKRNDSPATASRPYDRTRDGFVMGEGAASIVLETEEHAKARGAKIYAELAGGGVTSDSYHITAPDPEGWGASRAVRAALLQAGASPDDVTHINAHATSTPVGDIAEYKALLAVFGDRVHDIPVSATKASTGHLLGGTGALEAIFAILAVQQRLAPPTINLTEQDPEIPLDVVTSPRALGEGAQLAISNSFGFGGHNSVIAFRSV